MNDTWTERWNDRYSKDEFAFGKHPNNYLKEQLEKLKAGNNPFSGRRGRTKRSLCGQTWLDGFSI